MFKLLTRFDEVKIFAQPLAWPVIIFLFLSLIGSPLLNKTTLLLGILYLLTSNYKDVLIIGANSLRAYGVLLLMCWNLVSVSWSVAPAVSALNVVNDFEILFFSILAAYHARDKDLAESIKLTFITVIFIAVIYCGLFPGDSFSASGLRSFYTHKNNLGFVAGVGAVISIIMFKMNFLNVIFLLSSLTLLLLSQSKTSMLLVGVICILVLLISLIKLIYDNVTTFTQGLLQLLVKPLSFCFYIAIGALVLFREQVAGYLIAYLPYDALTGRGLLWVTVLTRSKDDLLLGLGQGSFWLAGAESEIQQTSVYYEKLGWIDNLISADGGYVDVVGAIGFVGLALLLVAFINVYKLNFKLMGRGDWKLYFSLITFLALHNVTETGFFKFTYPLWFTFFLITFYLIFIRQIDQGDKMKNTRKQASSNSHVEK